MNFTQVFIPRQLPCVRLAGQPGRGTTKDACLFQVTERRPTCKPLQTTPGRAATSSVLFHRRQPPGKPEPKHIFMQGGLDKEPLGRTAMGLLPSSFLWFQRGRERRSRDSPGTAGPHHDSTNTNDPAQGSSTVPNAGPPSPRTGERRQESWSAAGSAQREKEQTVRSYLTQGPIRGPGRPFFCFCTSSGENGGDY